MWPCACSSLRSRSSWPPVARVAAAEAATEPSLDLGRSRQRRGEGGQQRRPNAPVVIPKRTGIVYGMEKTTVYLTTTQKRALERAARMEGRSEADLISEGIDAVTRRHRVAEPRIPLFESGIDDLGSRTDEYLEGFGES